MTRNNTTALTTTKTESVPRADFDNLLLLVGEQQKQIEALQNGYLMVVEKMQEIAVEVVRLERHNGIGINSIIVPNNWRSMPKVK